MILSKFKSLVTKNNFQLTVVELEVNVAIPGDFKTDSLKKNIDYQEIKK